jgi:hypothetical protein
MKDGCLYFLSSTLEWYDVVRIFFRMFLYGIRYQPPSGKQAFFTIKLPLFFFSWCLRYWVKNR